MSIEENLEQTLFERGAEKCKNHSSRLAFCKAYLKKYGIDLDEIAKKTEEEKVKWHSIGVRSKENVFTYFVSKDIDRMQMDQQSNAKAFELIVKRDLARQIADHLIEKEFIQYVTLENLANDSINIRAGIKVAEWDR